jgi:hypothetical protein
LYNLYDDPGEARNVAGSNPEVVKRLNQKLEQARADMGDGTRAGANCRPVGKAKGPLRFLIPRHPDSGLPPHAPVIDVPGSPQWPTEPRRQGEPPGVRQPTSCP